MKSLNFRDFFLLRTFVKQRSCNLKCLRAVSSSESQSSRQCIPSNFRPPKPALNFTKLGHKYGQQIQFPFHKLKKIPSSPFLLGKKSYHIRRVYISTTYRSPIKFSNFPRLQWREIWKYSRPIQSPMSSLEIRRARLHSIQSMGPCFNSQKRSPRDETLRWWERREDEEILNNAYEIAQTLIPSDKVQFESKS